MTQKQDPKCRTDACVNRLNESSEPFKGTVWLNRIGLFSFIVFHCCGGLWDSRSSVQSLVCLDAWFLYYCGSWVKMSIYYWRCYLFVFMINTNDLRSYSVCARALRLSFTCVCFIHEQTKSTFASFIINQVRQNMFRLQHMRCYIRQFL